MAYTVHELAERAHISVRTLHHYDNIGLLKPSSHGKNGYRYYEEKELVILQQILFFRELDFSLHDIRHIISQPDFHVIEALREQKKLMKLKQARLSNLVKTIDHTIRTMQQDKKMNDNDRYDAFKDDDVRKYQAEVKERWGNTDAYKQSTAKVASLRKVEMDSIKKSQKELTEKIAEAMKFPINDARVQALVQKHYDSINFFYDCNLDMYNNLARMYVEDPRFKANYDKVKPGLAEYLRKAIEYYIKEHR